MRNPVFRHWPRDKQEETKDYKAYPYWFEIFEGFNQLHDTYMSREFQGAYSDRRDSVDDDYEWTDGFTFEQANMALTKGWKAPLPDIKRNINENLKTKKVARMTRPKSAIEGFAPNVPNALRGIPNAMLKHEVKPKDTKIVNIVYSVTISANFSSEKAKRHGAKLFQTIIQLEKMGYRVALYLATTIHFYADNDDHDVYGFIVKAKNEHQPINYEKLAFPLMSAAFPRRCVFRWQETVEGIPFAFGYGRPTTHDLKDHKVKESIRRALRLQDEMYYIDRYSDPLDILAEKER